MKKRKRKRKRKIKRRRRHTHLAVIVGVSVTLTTHRTVVTCMRPHPQSNKPGHIYMYIYRQECMSCLGYRPQNMTSLTLELESIAAGTVRVVLLPQWSS